MNQFLFIACLCIAGIVSCKPKPKSASENTISTAAIDTIHYDQEKHLANVHQLTFGGDNAEAYWSFDSKKLTFQATRKAWNTS
ncbi:MAG: hypothetical protein ABJB16_18075, partial [Saprospiraceae bacterium]